jgi:formate dehydrogenase major subunit
MKQFTRRGFLTLSGAAAAGLVLSRFGFDLAPIEAEARELSLKESRETPSICCYCSVGCGILVHTDPRGRVLNMEGDPDHPVSEGALCAKGAAAYQIAVNENRLRKVRYRAPYSDRWQEVSWAWALETIAAAVKKSREAGFMKTNPQGQVVNRSTTMASVGSAALDNEECWLYQKFLRALGLVYIEHQARI